MYVYDEYDQNIVDQRVAQYRDQTDRFLDGKLTEEEFLPLRLQNGLYVQRLAPMLRIAVPYGLLSSKQLRTIARITREYDKGYAHISTRQNIQLNWPRLEEVPDILAELASVQMHAIQTSGNCIRNTTTDQFAGVALACVLLTIVSIYVGIAVNVNGNHKAEYVFIFCSYGGNSPECNKFRVSFTDSFSRI